MSKKDWQYEYFRCIYCNHKGEWITAYVRCEGFMSAFNYMMNEPNCFIIKEISWKLENGELVGKLIEGDDLKKPTTLYPSPTT